MAHLAAGLDPPLADACTRYGDLEAALFWTGGVYNFCRSHATLDGTPAMAADLTDHVWSIDEFLRYRVRCVLTPRYRGVLPLRAVFGIMPL